MLVIDAHLDLSLNALQWNRNLLDSVYTIRATEVTTPGKGRGVRVPWRCRRCERDGSQ